MSMYRTKMQDLIARSKGKAFFVNAANLPMGLRTPEIMSDLASMGVLVGNKADPDMAEGAKDSRVIEPIDMTLDPTVMGMIQIMDEMKTTMEDIINIPRGVRGSPQGYQAYKTAELNRSQSTQGILSYYEAIEDFFINVIDYATETAKVMISKDRYTDLNLVIGDKGVKYLKDVDTRDLSFAKLRIFGQFDDLVKEKDKAEILGLAELAINSQQLDFADLIKVRGMKSARAMQNYLEARMKQKEREVQAQREQELALQQQQMQQNNQTQMQMTETQVQGSLENTAMKEEAATEREIIKQTNTDI
jgi:hypothetical protein